MNSRAVAEAIKRVCSSEVQAQWNIRGVSGHSVIVKRIVVPGATNAEVDASIQFDAEQHIPFQIAEVNLDYQRLVLWGPEILRWKSSSLLPRKTRFKITRM
jgi:type IV pilus assembly protein PilM